VQLEEIGSLATWEVYNILVQDVKMEILAEILCAARTTTGYYSQVY